MVLKKEVTPTFVPKVRTNISVVFHSLYNLLSFMFDRCLQLFNANYRFLRQYEQKTLDFLDVLLARSNQSQMAFKQMFKHMILSLGTNIWRKC